MSHAPSQARHYHRQIGVPPHMVQYVVGLKASAKQVRSAEFAEFLDRLAREYGHAELYESLRAKELGILYWDVDAKPTDTTADQLMARAHECLRAFFCDIPDYDPATYIVTATSHSADKLSVRFYCDRVLATPEAIKRRIKQLNLGASRGGVFDEMVYGATQKLRSVGSIKTKDDARVLDLLADAATLRDREAKARLLARTIIQQTPEDARTLPELTVPPRSHKRKTPPAGTNADSPPPAPAPPVARVAKVGKRRPEEADRPALLAHLEAAGFISPTFLDQARTDSWTFAARNRGDGLGDCPCCGHDHEKQNWCAPRLTSRTCNTPLNPVSHRMAMKETDGRFYVKSYSARCKGMHLGERTTVDFLADDAAGPSEQAPRSPEDVAREVVQVRRDVAALVTRVDGLSTAFRDFVQDVAPAISAEGAAAIDPGTIVRSGTAFQFNYADQGIPDQVRPSDLTQMTQTQRGLPPGRALGFSDPTAKP